jgi:TolB-like protein/tetratricopeptide (TPR) repeat protein
MGEQSPKRVSKPAGAVFLSYASQDAEAAQKICDALRAAGIEVWFDQSELRGGDAWDSQIRKQIHDCALFIPLISQHSQERLEGYFRLEWKLAVDRSHRMAAERSFIVPVVVDSTREHDALVPDAFRDVQWTHLPGGDASPAFVARVAVLLGASVPVATTNRPAPALASGSLSQTRNRRSLWIALGLAALVVVVGGGWVALRHAGMHASAEADVTGQPQPAVKERSIAVLPFADMSEKRDQEYFAEGMAEEILGVLAKVPRLTVISRTSSFQFKGRDVDIKTIGSTLGARYIVEGSVRKSGGRMRVTAQLIDTSDGAHRWSETYDRDVGDVFSVQDDIAGSIVRALELAVVGAAEIPARVKPKNPAAYDLYLRGRQAFDRYNRDGFEQAGDLYQQALELDPEFVPAINGLADVQLFEAQWGYGAPKVAYERARRTAERSMMLDSKLGEPHRILSEVHAQYDWDWAAAKREIDRALELDSRDPQAHAIQGLLSLSLGRLDEAASQLNAGLRLDPLSPNLLFNLGWARFWSGHLPEAEALFRRALQISPTYESVHYYLGHVLIRRGDLAGARTEMERELDDESRIAGTAAVEFVMGHRKESDAALAQLTKQAADDWASGIASVHAIRNEPDAAFAWLERAYAQRDEDLYIIKGNPLFQNVARDPRYSAFLRKMNLPE